MTTYEIGRPDLCTRLAMVRQVTIGAPQYISGGANIVGGVVVGSGASVVGGTGASPNAVGQLWPRGDGTPAAT